jgi:hypothetical protein
MKGAAPRAVDVRVGARCGSGGRLRGAMCGRKPADKLATEARSAAEGMVVPPGQFTAQCAHWIFCI